ncbi:MAG: alkaline phosphatase family protein [Sphingopyxis sp.]
MRTLISAFALLACSVTAGAQQSHPAPQPMTPVLEAEAMRPAPPKLIIVISVDQFSADLFTEYRGLFSGGLARLAGGVVFPQAYQAHGATETCPGHSTILTGSLPARTGIIANNWYDLSLAREDRRVYCSEDPSVEGTSSASGRYAPSINYLLVPTLGDLMKAADPRTRVVSVAGKDRAAIMMGGRAADELWWLSASGLSSYRGREQSPHVARISAAVVAAVAQPRAALDLPAQCAARSQAVDIGGGHSVGAGRLERAGGNFRGFMASPEADGAVLAAGASLAAVHRLGQGPQSDLLILGLSATDYVGHTYGTEGAEMCLQMLALDRELGDFFARMDASGVDYAVVLTADHGGHDLPERNQHNAMPDAERVDRTLDAAALSTRIKAELGMTFDGPLLYGDAPFGDYYLSRALSPADAARVLRAATHIIAAHPQVERVVLGATLAAMPIPRGHPEQWSVEQRLRASYMAGRSGDFLVVLKSRVTPIPETGVGYVATHGSVWDYDRRVPMLFWRAGMRSFEQPNPVMTVDILPTLAGLIGLPIETRNLDGRCLDLVEGAETSCPAP